MTQSQQKLAGLHKIFHSNLKGIYIKMAQNQQKLEGLNKIFHSNLNGIYIINDTDS